jgi:myo-inositol-1(or 4)-monophosphatase
MQAFWQQVLDFSQTITDEVGAKLLAAFGGAQAEEKQDGSLVTEFDKWSDERLRTAIHDTFPITAS